MTQPRVTRAALGVFLALVAVYVLTSAGRIDIIDGQVRYDVAKNWLDRGRPEVTDPGLLPTRYVVWSDGVGYSSYNAAASVSPMPLMLLSRILPGHTIERDRFAFSMAGPLFGAATGGALVLGYTMLGLALPAAVFWAAATSLTTLWWPGSLTVFDQNQHAFLALVSTLLAWQSGRRRRLSLAALGGLGGGLLITYQENYALLLPAIALAAFASPGEGVPGRAPSLRQSPDRAAALRYLAFGGACAVGVGLFAVFNYSRYGRLLQAGRYEHLVMFEVADPLAATLSLAVSPGKSALLFSPPLFLALVGVRRLFTRAPVLVAAIAITSIVHLLLIVQVSFFGGDWCWGPRYLLILLPLWALALPEGAVLARRSLVAGLVALGLVVQLMGVSVDYQRFFFEHNLRPFFWLDQWSYFKHSQFLSRPLELLAMARDGVPPEAKWFSPTPGGQITYTPGGPPDYSRQGAAWVRHFTVFHTLRPWPVWIGTLAPPLRPVSHVPLGLACAALLLAGVAFCATAVRGSPAGASAGAPDPGRALDEAAPARPPPRVERGATVSRGRRATALGLLLGALVAVAALHAGGIPYAGYEIHYGRFGWGPFELAFLVNYLFFGTLALGLAGAGLAAMAGDRFVALFDHLDRLRGRTVAVVGAVAVVALVVLVTLVRVGLLRDTAITDDENVYTFMARVFATGRLYAPSPPAPIRPFFDNQFIVNDGKWYGMFFPGHAFLLAIGQWLGAPRWVPTASAVLTALLAFGCARRMFGRRVAVLTLALLVVSPYFVMSSATLLAHSTAALFLMSFLYAILRAQEPAAHPAWWLGAGLALGGAGLTRPLAAAAYAIPWLVWLGLRLRRDTSARRIGGSALFALGGALAFGMLCLYNLALGGAPFQTGYHTYSTRYGFPVDIGAIQAPYPLPSVYELGYTLERLDFWLFGWPVSLLLLPFFRRTAESVALLAASGAVVLAYAASTLPTINATGPAHYSELAAPLVMLSASGLEQLVERARRGWPARGAQAVLGAMVAAIIVALLVFVPVYGTSLRAMSAIARAPYDLVESRQLARAVVFVHSLPSLTWRPGAWVYFHRNPAPDLSDRVLFVKDLGPERNTELMRAMPDRTPFAMGVRDRELLLVPLRP